MDRSCIVFDFDETLYRKDSLLTFHLFCVRKNPLLLCWLPVQVWGYVLHMLGVISTQQFKNWYIVFLAFYSEQTIQQKATTFWDEQFPQNFNAELLSVLNSSTEQLVIITASPVLYIQPLLAKLPALTLLGTNLQQKGGLYFIAGNNCKGAEKVVRFNERFGTEVTITKSYSDSLSDAPILGLAEQAFIVKGDTITPYQP